MYFRFGIVATSTLKAVFFWCRKNEKMSLYGETVEK